MVPPGSSRTPVLGTIADDITGASDLAGALVRAGLATVQVFGLPPHDERLPECDAIVVALKTRNCAPADAVGQSLAAATWLRRMGTERTYFKYCSTFDSTSAGNIGPVAEALSASFGNAAPLVHGPAYPVNERTLYRGHLFVGDLLLSESGMREHPLTPMTDANLVRVLGRQTAATVGLLPLMTVRRGWAAITAHLADLSRAGVGHVLADALEDDDLDATARAAAGHPVAAGAAAFGAAWGAVLVPARAGRRHGRPNAPAGSAAVLVGSASRATAAQVAAVEPNWPVLRLDPDTLEDPVAGAQAVLRWARRHLGAQPILVTADTSANGIRAARDRFGDTAVARIEATLSAVAAGLVELGVRRLVVAGGETSGAVAAALKLAHVTVGPQICPGVPWTLASDPDLAVAFKSGNFGGASFFTDAFAHFDSDEWEQS